ncbi:MAG: response regulator [Rhodothermales bacterium]
MKILVVDDERDVEFLFRQRFRKEIRQGEIDLAFAFSGEEALHLLGDEDRADVVLVLSDINMPGMNGLELLRRIKQTPPPIPVCMMTAYGNDEYRQKAREYGSDGYLTKPVDFDDLKQRIRSLSAV